MDPNLNQAPPAGVGAPEALSQDQMRANLENLKSSVDEKFRDMNSKEFIAANKADATRKAMIEEALKALKRAGVDFNDPESLKKFMTDLEAANPDVFQLFEEAFNSLLQGEDVAATEQASGVAPSPSGEPALPPDQMAAPQF